MFDLDEVANAVGAAVPPGAGGIVIKAVGINSRELEPGSLFVCIKGDHHDGHAYMAQAAEAGAVAIMASVDWQGEVPRGLPVLRVREPVRALGQLARAWRRKLGIRVLAVTGSSGKTSTKEMLAAYLARWFTVAKTEANQNNEIGVPLTLLALRADNELAVVEMGMRGPGEIAYLAEVAEPDVGLITNIGSAHIGRLGSLAAIAEAKTELWRHMPAASSLAYPLADSLAAAAADACLSAGDERAGAHWSLTDPAATVWAHDVLPAGEGQVFTVYWKAGLKGSEVAIGRAEIKLPLWGDHHRANALAAIAVGWLLGKTPPPRLEIQPDALPGRSRLIRIGQVLVTDDAYNANPDSMRAALGAFAQAPATGRRVAVLGDMAELGEKAADEHDALGAFVARLALDEVVAIGDYSARYCTRQTDRYFAVPELACSYLANTLQAGDRVLLKASRAARFEGLIDRLQALLSPETT